MFRRCLALLAAGAFVTGCSQARTPPAEGGGSGTSETLARCTECHGDAANGNAAPPVSVAGTSATTDVRVGAHQAHLHDSTIRQAVACSECHVVPTDPSSPGHIDKPTADVVFGTVATTGDNPPPQPSRYTYVRSADGTVATCAVYCHGASFASGNGTIHQPSWTRVDGSQAACGTCHGIPPPAPHPNVGTSLANCSGCHPDTVKPDGTIDVARGKHINGQVDLVGAGGGNVPCTTCHGDAARGTGLNASAPPRDIQGNTASTAAGVGAHQPHLNGGALAAPLACNNCHPVPSDLAHASQPLQLSWSALASGDNVTPTFDQTALTCTNYCHGASLTGGSLTRPVWNKGPTQAACGTCHGLPPTSNRHGGSHTGFACFICHGDGYTSSTVVAATHVDGTKNVGGRGSQITTWVSPLCTPTCHNTRPWPSP